MQEFQTEVKMADEGVTEHINPLNSKDMQSTLIHVIFRGLSRYYNDRQPRSHEGSNIADNARNITTWTHHVSRGPAHQYHAASQGRSSQLAFAMQFCHDEGSVRKMYLRSKTALRRPLNGCGVGGAFMRKVLQVELCPELFFTNRHIASAGSDR